MTDMSTVVFCGGIITLVLVAIISIIKAEINYREECKRIDEFFEQIMQEELNNGKNKN